MSKVLKLRRIADLELETAQATDQLLAQRNGLSVRVLASDFATSADGTLAQTAIQPEDIDTLAELNGILTDATLIDTNDSRLSDARPPTAHKSTHSTGGADALSPADIGAATAAQGALADSAVQPARQVATGTGLSGGGDLSADRTLALSSASQSSLALADTAVQPGDLAAVATSGAYSDLSGLPTLGTAAAQDSTAFATSAQGTLADSAVQPTRQVATGTGLSGGGNLSADRTISLANTTVVAGAYGSATQSATFSVDAQGRLTSAASVTVTPSFASLTSTPTTLSGYGITDAVPNTRQVAAGTGLTGGGDLSADRTLALSSASQASLALADSAVQPATLQQETERAILFAFFMGGA